MGSSQATAFQSGHREAPIVRFANGAWLEGSWLYRPTIQLEPFTRERIEVWDWTSGIQSVRSYAVLGALRSKRMRPALCHSRPLPTALPVWKSSMLSEHPQPQAAPSLRLRTGRK
jgi:hypothetical protein